MSPKGSSQPDQPQDTQAISQAREAFSERLSQSADIKSTCQTALKAVLEIIDRSAGVLVVSSLAESAPDLLVTQGLSRTWSTQVEDLTSELHRLARQVLESGESVTSKNLPAVYTALDNLAVALPIKSGLGLQGALLVQGENPSPEEIGRLAHLIPAIADSICTSRMVSAVQERAADLATLQTELAQMGLNTNFENMEAHMLQGICRVLNGELGALILIDKTDADWMVHKAIGKDSKWLYQVNLINGPGLIRKCLRNSESVCVNQLSANPQFDPASDTFNGIQARSMLCEPMIVSGQTVGAIQVLNKRNGNFDKYDQDLLSMASVLVANAMHSSQLIQQLKLANADLEASRWELLNSRNTLRALFDHIPSALYIIDQEFQLVAINKSRARYAGQPPQALVEKLCYQALFKQDEPCTECRVKETLQDRVSSRRHEQRTGEGDETFEWEISAYPIFDESQDVVQAILLETDMTEKHRLEDILAQSEKLATIGQLAAGIAHEINNPLTAIIANAQILRRELPPEDDLQESVDLIARAGARATQVVRNLLDFSRKEDYRLRLTDLNESMDRALELVQHELMNRGVRLSFKPESSLPPILASMDHLQGVWLNLLLNAIDSLDKSPGEIMVTTKRLGDEILVSVSDNGKGIPPDHLTRIFEPFYTTKAPGRGTGLGLSVSHRIIKQHGGRIRVESQVGAGSQFTVFLPLS